MVASRNRKKVISLALVSLLFCTGCGDNAGFFLAKAIEALNAGLVVDFLNSIDPKPPEDGMDGSGMPAASLRNTQTIDLGGDAEQRKF